MHVRLVAPETPAPFWMRRVEQLTPRQLEVLRLMADGLSNESISRALYLSERTVESHVAAIFTTLGLKFQDGIDRRVAAVVAYLTTQPAALPLAA